MLFNYSLNPQKGIFVDQKSLLRRKNNKELSAEFTEKYGSNVSDETYVNNLYKNVLGRDADTEGLNYWVGNLSSGVETRYEALLGFAESAENKVLFTDMTGFG